MSIITCSISFSMGDGCVYPACTCQITFSPSESPFQCCGCRVETGSVCDLDALSLDRTGIVSAHNALSLDRTGSVSAHDPLSLDSLCVNQMKLHGNYEHSASPRYQPGATSGLVCSRRAQNEPVSRFYRHTVELFGCLGLLFCS